MLLEIIRYLLLMSIVAFAGWIFSQSSFYRDLQQASKSRFATLDGLRGILAVSVFVHHGAYYINYYASDKWNMEKQSFTFMLGTVSVSVFFMVTGFLFWSKAIAARGRLRVLPLYVSRIRRIYPMLIVLLTICLIINGIRTDWTLVQPAPQVAFNTMKWLTGGFFGFPPINDTETWYHTGMTWTLQYEAWFYLLLPALAIVFWRWWSFAALMVLGAGLLPFTYHYVNYANLSGFAFGAVAAYCVEYRSKAPFSSLTLSFVAVLFAFGLCWAAYLLPSYSWRFLAFPIFLAVLYGASIFGLLIGNAWQFLGTASYSIYLLHCLVLYLGLGAINRIWPVSTLSPVQSTFALAVCGIAVVIVSGITYRTIEYPLMVRGPVKALQREPRGLMRPQ